MDACGAVGCISAVATAAYALSTEHAQADSTSASSKRAEQVCEDFRTHLDVLCLKKNLHLARNTYRHSTLTFRVGVDDWLIFLGLFFQVGEDVSAGSRAAGGDSSKMMDLVLYQYDVCPFCCKVKAFLDYYNVPYRTVEVSCG